MRDKRPVNLNLASLSYPAMAIVSILHRISGIILFILLPFMLVCLNSSLSSERSFVRLQLTFNSSLAKALLWSFSAAYIYHILAGVRHLLIDLGIGEHLDASRRNAKFLIILAIILIIFVGIRLC